MIRREPRRPFLSLAGVLVGLTFVSACPAAPPDSADPRWQSPVRETAGPSAAPWRRVLRLEDYNTRIVVAGTTLLGCAAGMVGSFTLLRKRALMGDALSHATLPGIGLAFIIATAVGGNGKSLPWLLTGATISGLLAVATILLLRNLTRLKEDAALAAVLSVYFGAGIAILGVVQQMPTGHAAGLESFIYGKTASMGVVDVQLISVAAVLAIVACLLCFKELTLLCFDEGFAASRGMRVTLLDLVLMGVVVLVSIVGLQAVGLILMIALLVIPAAAARFWTERMSAMFVIAGLLGAASGCAGAGVSALFSKLPSGATIVLVCAGVFAFSACCGPRRGWLPRLLRRVHLARSIDRQHVLRAVYELSEDSSGGLPRADASPGAVSISELLPKRSWSLRQLKQGLARAAGAELLMVSGDRVQLTRRGLVEAARLTRQHRLWELYLITHADLAPSMVDRDADAIEHVLEPEVIAELEALLPRSGPQIPGSPHELNSAPAT